MKLLPKSFLLILSVALAALAGCSDHKPYGHDDAGYRPKRGLGRSEVQEASDLLAQKLLALPEVNSGLGINPAPGQEPRRLTIVFTGLEDRTRGHLFNYDIFLERLKTNVSEQARDRIAIVSNKDQYYRIRGRETDSPTRERDDFAQGDGARRPAPTARIQPDYAMTGKVMDMADGRRHYYLFTFTLADIRANGGGLEIPMRYEVEVAR